MTNLRTERAISTQAPEQGAVKVGDYAVIRRSEWRVVAVKVSKVTDKQIKASGEWSSRDFTYRRDDVLFAGSEPVAKELVAALEDSYQQYTADRSLAFERKADRDRAAIAKATGSNA